MDYGSNQPFSIENPNQDKGKLYGGKVVPGGGTLKVQGSPGLDIPGLESIQVEVHDGTTYSYDIAVTGGCPEGKQNNHLHFTDETGDTYSLKIISENKKKKHTVRYSSSNPVIKQVTWDI